MDRYDGLLITILILLGVVAGYEMVDWLVCRYWRQPKERQGFPVVPTKRKGHR